MAPSDPKLQKTRNYAQFISSKTNRVLQSESFRPQHVRLMESMRKFGFLPSFPITVRMVGGKLQVEDGQHRLYFAKTLGIDVFFVVIDKEIDVAEINQAQATWQVKDYTNRWAQAGNVDYIQAHEFADRYSLPISDAFGLLTLNSSFGNISKQVRAGAWKITELEKATVIAQCYSDVCACQGVKRHKNLYKAVYACNFVPGFDSHRLIDSIQKRAGSWINGGHWIDYLQQLEDFYNFGRKVKVPLKFDAQESMRLRSAASKRPA